MQAGGGEATACDRGGDVPAPAGSATAIPVPLGSSVVARLHRRQHVERVDCADAALYRAKENGRDRVESATQEEFALVAAAASAA